MLNSYKKPDYHHAFSVLTDGRSGARKIAKLKRALRCRYNTPRQYMALVFLFSLRGAWGEGDRYEVSFNVLLSFLKDHSFFEEIKACVCSPFIIKEYERGAVHHNYYALCFLAWAYYYGWGVAKNDDKAKELVLRAQKIGGKLNEKEFNEEIFSLIIGR